MTRFSREEQLLTTKVSLSNKNVKLKDFNCASSNDDNEIIGKNTVNAEDKDMQQQNDNNIQPLRRNP